MASNVGKQAALILLVLGNLWKMSFSSKFISLLLPAEIHFNHEMGSLYRLKFRGSLMNNLKTPLKSISDKKIFNSNLKENITAAYVK